ncbi:MAG: ATP-binding cassette domain-containing protein [Christensenellales bacterium]
MVTLGLGPDEKKPVGKYSLGQRQRLGFAQAFMENPDVLILDEPFNAMDKASMEEVHDLLPAIQTGWKDHHSGKP